MIISATIFIPNKKHEFFIKKIEKYVGRESGTDVIGTVESIQAALLEAFWIGNKEAIPKDDKSIWCEVWLRYELKEDVSKVKNEVFQPLQKFGHKDENTTYIVSRKNRSRS